MLTDNDYQDAVQTCAQCIHQALENKLNIKLVIGNGLQYLPVWKPKRILEFEALVIHYKQQGDDTFIQRYRSLSRIERENLFRDEKVNIQRVLSSMSQEEREVLVW